MIYSLSVSLIPVAVATFPLAELISGATHRCALLEMVMQQTGGSGTTPALGRSSSVGTPSAAERLASEVPGAEGSIAKLATAWSTFPGFPTQYLRRHGAAIVIGGGAIWSFPRGLLLGSSSSLVLLNITPISVASAVSVVINE